MRGSYRAFIDALTASADVVTMQDAVAALAAAFGLPLFAYISDLARRSTIPLLISNYPPNWTDHYLNCRYDRLDPIIERAQRVAEPFYWSRDEYRSHSSGAQIAFFEEAKSYGIASGLTIPLGDITQATTALTFASDDNESTIRKVLERHGSALHLASLLFHRRARILQTGKYSVGGIYLSRREYQSLLWASRGKSAWETSQILGISQRTVEFYWESVRAKLQVRTMTQAAVRLALSGRDHDLT
jgi:DNA-binding CsgD family transcriptional regulator